MSACYECSGGGLKHGCCDDLCIGGTEPEDCPNARVCPVCKGDGSAFYDDYEDESMIDGYA